MITKLWKRGLLALALLACVAFALARGNSREAKSPLANETTLLAGSTVPPQVRQILERACQNCHSENTAWPWYSEVPPLSWQIHSDVNRGRAFLNFSKWSEYKEDQRRGFALAIMTATQHAVMPPAKYTWLHSEARLSEAHLITLRTWALGQTRRAARTTPEP
jgi:hypothetical protein